MVHVAVFGSGRGSNFEAILSAMDLGGISNVVVCLVLSNNSTAGILEIARARGIDAVHLSRRQFPSESEFVEEMRALLHRHNTDMIVLAGYMKRIPVSIVSEYRRRIINVHPALLPKFGGEGMFGRRVHEAVLAAGEEASGATVHFVDEEYDHGEIILQQRVPVLPGDSADTLAARVLTVEHTILPEAVKRLAALISPKERL
jgi:phosphoribosylglycinamide formyltransferase-1